MAIQWMNLLRPTTVRVRIDSGWNEPKSRIDSIGCGFRCPSLVFVAEPHQLTAFVLCPDQFNQLLLRGYAEPQSRLNVPLEGTSLTAGLSVAVASKPKYTIVWFVIPFSVIRGGWWAARTPSLLHCVSRGCLVCPFELICFNCCSPFQAANVAKLRFHAFVCPLGLCY